MDALKPRVASDSDKDMSIKSCCGGQGVKDHLRLRKLFALLFVTDSCEKRHVCVEQHELMLRIFMFAQSVFFRLLPDCKKTRC